jgi:BCD family chlorophyll transporter-like MFS transporter
MSIAITQSIIRHSTFGWLSIVRLGLVQASIGAIVVMTTSTLNRIMVVELRFASQSSWTFSCYSLFCSGY